MRMLLGMKRDEGEEHSGILWKRWRSDNTINVRSSFLYKYFASFFSISIVLKPSVNWIGVPLQDHPKDLQTMFQWGPHCDNTLSKFQWGKRKTFFIRTIPVFVLELKLYVVLRIKRLISISLLVLLYYYKSWTSKLVKQMR